MHARRARIVQPATSVTLLTDDMGDTILLCSGLLLLGLWTLWATRSVVHKSTALPLRWACESMAATVEHAEHTGPKATVQRPSSVDEGDGLADQRLADEDLGALPLDHAVAAHPAHRRAGGSSGWRRMPSQRRGEGA